MLFRKFFSPIAVIGFALCAAVPPANAQVNVDIYQSSGWPEVGVYGTLLGSFNAPDVNFGSADKGWFPFSVANDFAAVVTGNLSVSTAGIYTFNVYSDDGHVLSIDNETVIKDAWLPTVPLTFSGSADLTAGVHSFRIDYFECCGNPGAVLRMDLPNGVTYAIPVPEPETYAMLLAGLGVLGFAVRRRRQHAA